jgi:uncharacterized protein (TIGR03067 family)
VCLGCQRPSSSESGDQAHQSPDKSKAIASESATIVGTWEIVGVRYDDREHPDLTGTLWTFDDQFLHEIYGDDFAHWPHGPREYCPELKADPPRIYLESHFGCLVGMSPTDIKLDSDTLQLTRNDSLLTLRRVSKEPRLPSRSSWEAAEAFMERATQEGKPSEIDGAWQATSMICCWGEMKCDESNFVSAQFSEGSATYVPVGPNLASCCMPDKVYFEVDPTTSPKQIDLLIDTRDGHVGGGVERNVGIYRMENGKLFVLTVCWGKRPASFKSYVPDHATLWIYDRVADPSS